MLASVLSLGATLLISQALAVPGIWDSASDKLREPPQITQLPAPEVEARIIVHVNEWGVLSTISHQMPGVPFGNVLSFSDGPVDRSTGRPFFYMRSDDPTAQDARVNSNASLAISEAQTGSCGRRHLDQEDPNCARLAMAGRLLEVPAAELAIAHDALFSRHPQMIDWPPNHHFVAFEFHVDSIRMLDQYGPHIDVNADDYYSVEVGAVSTLAS